MKRILYGMCFTLFLLSSASAKNENTIDVEVLTRTNSSWDGKTLPEYPKGRPEISILKIVVPPGAEVPLHKHLVINAGVLLKGELTVVTEGGMTLHLKAGDPIVELVNKWHYGKNEGEEPAEILIFYAGIEGQPLSIKR
ncbi:MAG TPA: cupin domain-containing protein [Porticoccus sp.]|nr:cupin domain-containing protein [Porticoccus sp.]